MMALKESTETSQALAAQAAAPGSGFDYAKALVDGLESQWTIEQFRRMPLLDRVRLLAGGEVRFFRGGAQVPAREALRAL